MFDPRKFAENPQVERIVAKSVGGDIADHVGIAGASTRKRPVQIDIACQQFSLPPNLQMLARPAMSV